MMPTWEKVRRRQYARENPYRCSGVNRHGGRCLSSGTRKIDGLFYCRWHSEPHPTLERKHNA